MTETIRSPQKLLTFLVKAQGCYMSNIGCLVGNNANMYTLQRGNLRATVNSCPDLEPFFIEVLANVSPAGDGQRSLWHLIDRFADFHPTETAVTAIVLQALEEWAATLASWCSADEQPFLRFLANDSKVSFLFTTNREHYEFMIPRSMASEMMAIFGPQDFAYRPGLVAQYARSGKIDRLLADAA